MKFIHTADIHLDSPLIGLASYQNAPVQALRTASRDAFTRLIDVAIDEAVDFMVIAGDLYDGNWRDFNTGHFFVREMGRLPGNLSFMSAMTRSSLAKSPAFATRSTSSYRAAAAWDAWLCCQRW